MKHQSTHQITYKQIQVFTYCTVRSCMSQKHHISIDTLLPSMVAVVVQSLDSFGPLTFRFCQQKRCLKHTPTLVHIYTDPGLAQTAECDIYILNGIMKRNVMQKPACVCACMSKCIKLMMIARCDVNMPPHCCGHLHCYSVV